jgi:hypothetical protein
MARNGKHGNILTCSGGRDDGVKGKVACRRERGGGQIPATRVRSTGH